MISNRAQSQAISLASFLMVNPWPPPLQRHLAAQLRNTNRPSQANGSNSGWRASLDNNNNSNNNPAGWLAGRR